MSARGRTAVVVGAGIGGLAAAGTLARAGWRVTLLERASRIRAEPTAVVLWPAGVRALEVLGLSAGLPGVATAVPEHGVRRPDGQWLVPPRADDGPGPVVVHREDLYDALVAGLGDRQGAQDAAADGGTRVSERSERTIELLCADKPRGGRERSERPA